MINRRYPPFVVPEKSLSQIHHLHFALFLTLLVLVLLVNLSLIHKMTVRDCAVTSYLDLPAHITFISNARNVDIPEKSVSTDKRYEEENVVVKPLVDKKNKSIGVDYLRPYYRPWPNQSQALDLQNCHEFDNRFARHGTFLPTFYLASFPGSGNTWLRYLIEGVTGYFTRGPDNDFPDMIQAGFIGNTEAEADLGTTILQKTHSDWRHGKHNSSTKSILLIRNPIEATVTYRHFTFARKLGRTEDVHFSGINWRCHIYRCITHWMQETATWICREWRAIGRTSVGQLHVVHYENLVENTQEEILKMLDFMNHTVDPERLKCTMAYNEGQYHRPAKQEKLLFPFSKTEMEFIEEAICFVDELLRRQNLTRLPLGTYVKQLHEKYYFEENYMLPTTLCSAKERDFGWNMFCPLAKG